MLIDYHMHLEDDDYPGPCRFTVDRVREYVEAARGRGVQEIAVTEHGHRFRQFAGMMRPLLSEAAAFPEYRRWAASSFREDLDTYVSALQEAKAQGLPVKVGIEVDWIPGQEEPIAAALAGYPWDVVLGSVHFLGNWCIDFSPDVGWPERDVNSVYVTYCRAVAEAASSGLFDVLSHLDLVKKFGHRPTVDVSEEWQRVVEAAARAGCAVEVSTAGLRKKVGEIYPGADLLLRCREAGIPITLASDAHEPENVGYGLAEAVAWAKAAGYKQLVRFEGRRQVPAPLGAEP